MLCVTDGRTTANKITNTCNNKKKITQIRIDLQQSTTGVKCLTTQKIFFKNDKTLKHDRYINK